MNKLMIRVALALVIGAMAAAPAFADVFVTATITKDVDIDIFELVTLDKNIRMNIINPTPNVLDGAGEAAALANQENLNNFVAHGTGSITGNPTDDANITISIDLTNSALRNQGILGINQDIGNMVNQANIVSAAITGSPAGGTFADAQAEGEQVNAGNTSTASGTLEALQIDPLILIPDKAPIITGSVNEHVGAIGVNQNAGNMNNQLNNLALAIGLGADVALSEASLGQFNGVSFVDEVLTANQNEVSEFETVKVNTITNSVNLNTGIVQVNQTSGNMNNQGSVISFSGLIPGVTALP